MFLPYKIKSQRGGRFSPKCATRRQNDAYAGLGGVRAVAFDAAKLR